MGAFLDHPIDPNGLSKSTAALQITPPEKREVSAETSNEPSRSAPSVTRPSKCAVELEFKQDPTITPNHRCNSHARAWDIIITFILSLSYQQ